MKYLITENQKENTLKKFIMSNFDRVEDVWFEKRNVYYGTDTGEETVIFGYHRITDINILSSNGKKVRVTMSLMNALYFNVNVMNILVNYCLEKWKRRRPLEMITEVEEELYRKRLRIKEN